LGCYKNTPNETKERKMKKILLAGLSTGLIIGIAASSAHATSLVNGLGGTSGFGENSLARNDDGSTSAINITSVFASGLNFFGTTYNTLFVNNNGNITLNSALNTYTPSAITGVTSNPIIAAFFADVDTRGAAVTASAGGNSTGSNLLWYDLDALNKTFTATWDDVGFYSYHTSPVNAFQIILKDRSDVAAGDFDITFIYEDMGWTVGDVSGTTYARAGWSSGNGSDYYEMPQSGNVAALTNLENDPGTITWQVRNGTVVPSVPEPCTLLLFGTGMAGLAAVGRRKAKK
jgi:hypothetical protein